MRDEVRAKDAASLSAGHCAAGEPHWHGLQCVDPPTPVRMLSASRVVPNRKPHLLPVLGTVAGCLVLAAAVLRVLAGTMEGWQYDLRMILIGSAAASFAIWRLSTRTFRQSEADAHAAGAAAQDELRRTTERSEALTRAIVATATEGIVSIDSSGHIETFNGAAERMFGYQAHEVIGRNVSLLMPPPYREEHDSYLQRYLRTGEARIIGIGREVSGLRRNGSTFPIDLSVGEGFAEGKRFFTAIVRDISDRKEIQGKLAQTERLAAVGELAAGVAHEVNNPINTVINCAQLIKDGDEAGPNCDVIIGEGERIATIVKDLLQFARDDRDHPQPTALPEVVTRTLRLIGESLKRHGIDLGLAVPEDLPLVHARPQQVQQVLLNLLINAKDALVHITDRAREVRLSAIADAGGVTLSVRDNGPGIPPGLINRVFEPFVTTKRAHGGTGLGLSISKSIVEGYGGRIDVDSEPGRGAEFRVWLPRSAEGKD
jgi:two-component system, LuxR family, sensor kinase FixL